jgi:hypothetical protein
VGVGLGRTWTVSVDGQVSVWEDKKLGGWTVWGWLHSSVSAISALNLKMIKMANFVIFLLQ